MSKFAVIVQNDVSEWHDIKGKRYHYPARYREILTPGCQVVYYKGTMTNEAYKLERLSPDPHYFGIAVVGDSVPDTSSTKKDFYCGILEYQEFPKAVPIKLDGQYLEIIPESRVSNYWRDGVRKVGEDVFDHIRQLGTLGKYTPNLPDPSDDLESSRGEGTKKQRFSTYYERNPTYRELAVEIHGVSCMVCGTNFQDRYGPLGKDFIHVHHNKPISETGPTRIDPKTDMSVVCPNCHSMIHRKRAHTLSIAELRDIYKADKS